AGNMPQWNFIDYGAQRVNMPTAPLFPTISKEDLKYILNHSEARAIFVSDRGACQKLLEMKDELLHLRHIIALTDIPGEQQFSDFLSLGREHLNETAIRAISQTITADDLYTILYTSGTTG